MTRSSFLRGAVFGSLATLLIGATVFVAVIVGSSSTGGEPDPTASRREIADGRVGPEVEVGDAVEGTIIDVEVDPGSGAWWSLWESLTETTHGGG